MSSERKIIAAGSDLIDNRADVSVPLSGSARRASVPKFRPLRTAIAGRQIGDTYYPQYRSISQSGRFGRLMACTIDPP